MKPKHYGLKNLDIKQEKDLTEEEKKSGRYVKMNRAQRREYARMLNSRRKANAKRTRQRIEEIKELAEKLGDSPSGEVGHTDVRTNQEGKFGVRTPGSGETKTEPEQIS